jgi:hypothetical protein
VPVRVFEPDGRLRRRLPTNWPWAGAFLVALTRINTLPMRSCRNDPASVHNPEKASEKPTGSTNTTHTDSETAQPSPGLTDHQSGSTVHPG